MNLAILGLGTAVPPTRLPQADAEKVARAMCAATPEQAEALSVLYRQTAIADRHILFRDRKSTRLNSSHVSRSYAVFCLKKKRPSTPAGVARGWVARLPPQPHGSADTSRRLRPVRSDRGDGS